MDMTVEEKLEKLAALKIAMKNMDSEIKALQKVLIEDDGVACDFVTPYGKLAFKTRENYQILDKVALIKHMGQKAYNAHSTISKTGITKAIGDLGFQEVLDRNLMGVKSMSQYFELRK